MIKFTVVKMSEYHHPCDSEKSIMASVEMLEYYHMHDLEKSINVSTSEGVPLHSAHVLSVKVRTPKSVNCVSAQNP